jgi:glycosyltransferase involved in cell wall biosynthesis
MLRRNHQVLVVTSDWQSSKNDSQNFVKRILHLHNFEDIDGIKKRISQLHQAATSLQDYQTVRKLCLGFQPDLAYIWNMSRLSLKALDAFTKLDVPIVLDLGDYWLSVKLAEFANVTDKTKRFYRSLIHGGFRFDNLDLKYLLCNSKTLKKHYINHGIPEDVITVIPRGLKAENVTKEINPLDYGKEIRLVYVGRLTETKGAHIAIEALSKFGQYNRVERIALDLYGTGEASYTEKLKKMSLALGLEQNVTYLGHVPRRELLKSFQRYHILLCPSIWVEPFGNVVMEAMAQGLCVIASNHGGPAELIDHGQDGLLVPAEDPDSLAGAIIKLIDNPDYAEDMRRVALDKIRNRFVFGKIGEQIEAYLQEVVAKHSIYRS